MINRQYCRQKGTMAN